MFYPPLPALSVKSSAVTKHHAVQWVFRTSLFLFAYPAGNTATVEISVISQRVLFLYSADNLMKLDWWVGFVGEQAASKGQQQLPVPKLHIKWLFFFCRLFPTDLFEIFIDIGHYVRDISAYEDLVSQLNLLLVSFEA